MEPEFWLNKWRLNEIGFHQGRAHAALDAHWAALALPRSARVLVPLAGKSLDMLWLAAHGHPVLGCELSEIAVRAFFEENGLRPEVEPAGSFARYRARAPSGATLEILQGDLFALDPAEAGPIDAIFDRAALIALPAARRADYARHIGALTTTGARMLLVALEYPQSQMPGPPFAVEPAEIERLYSALWRVELLARDTALADFPRFRERGVSRLAETVYRLER